MNFPVLTLSLCLLISSCGDSTRIVVESFSRPLSVDVNLFVKAEKRGERIYITIREFFYNDGAATTPTLERLQDNNAILYIGSKKKFGFPHKCEYQRDLVVSIPSTVLTKGSQLAVYNNDTGRFSKTIVVIP